MALFIRYCAPCNSTQTIADRDTKGLKCGECGAPLKIADACALIPALGAKLDVGQRESAVAGLQGHDLPRA